MPRTELDSAVNDLRKWFRLFSLQEFVAGDLVRLSPATPSVNANDPAAAPSLEPGSGDNSANVNGTVLQGGGEVPPLIDALASVIVKTQRGGLTSPGLINELVRISEEFKQAGVNNPQLANQAASFALKDIIAPFYEQEVRGNETGIPASISEILGDFANQDNGGINSNPNSPSKDAPTVSMIFNRSTRISLSNKNGNALSIFFNAIPTMEWSRAIPFLDVKFQFQRPSISSDNRPITPSTNRFLEGATPLTSSPLTDSFDLKLHTAVSRDKTFELAGNANPDGVGEAGTELFLLPQTLINANADNGEEFRVTPIIDKFRPLASLRKFEVDVSQAAGVMSYRTAKLSFTLHDRSRLNEIADFIKAGLYNKTEMLIEWGWEHPDKNKGNAFAAFINALKIKEKYQISNYDLQMKANGEVDINLSIFTKGGVDMFTSKIADSDASMEPQEFIRQLQERISQLRQRVFKQNQRFVEEIRGQQILNMAGDNNANLSLSPALRRELRKTLSQLTSNPSESAKELRSALEELFGTDGTDGAAAELSNTISEQINKKMKLIKGRTPEQGGIERTPDPFLDPSIFNDGLKRGEKFEQFVSLAKLMLLFVIQPLARTKKFDDIQVIFYNLNNQAGFGAHTNLGEFPIEIGNFQKNFKKLATQRRTANISVREFISFVSNRYLEDISNPLYGLRDFYRYEPDKETGKRNIPVKKFRNNPTALNSAIEEKMREAGVPDGIFELPHIDMYVECVPASPENEGDPTNIFEGLTVLRIHVFDRKSTAFESQQAFLAAQRRDSIRTLGNISLDVAREESEEGKKERTAIKELVRKAKERELIEVITPLDGKGSDQVVRFKGGPREIKNFIAETMPTIIFGTNNTAVLEAGLRTMQDQKLTTINMINAGDKGDLTPNGGATNGLPIRLFPAQMNMRTFGCPIIEFTQSMFCDFQTGTSFDNIYAATKIQHSLEPGKFYTSITWTPLDAYGQYQSVVENVGAAIAVLSDFDGSDQPIGVGG